MHQTHTQLDPEQSHYRSAFMLLSSLFFLWGLITTINGTLVPYFKDIFSLSYFQAGLVDWAFFIAFLFMSIPSARIIERYGFKTCLQAGVALLLLGCLVFLLASKLMMYWVFLLALFIMGIGITLLQVAANPFVAALGKASGAPARLNLSQALNSMGKFLAPLIGAWLILDVSGLSVTEKLTTVQLPYLAMAAVLLICLLGLSIAPLPKMQHLAHQGNHQPDHSLSSFLELMRIYPHLRFGVIAIFILVGIEVSVVHYGNSYISTLSITDSALMMANQVLAIVSFGQAQPITGLDLQSANVLVAFILLGELLGRFIGSWLLRTFPSLKASRMLTVHAISGILLLMVSIVSSGNLSFLSFVMLGLCNSIMWSNIFTLSLEELGEDRAKASSLLVTAIVGGAFIPLLVGLAADISGQVKYGFTIIIFCYAYIAWFGWAGHLVKNCQEKRLNQPAHSVD